MTTQVTNRQQFLEFIYNGIVSSGFRFQSAPDFREGKHGNLKFTDPRLTLPVGENKVILTLEHYHIRREGWHPVYWGLQYFDATLNQAQDPYTLPRFEALVSSLSAAVSAAYGRKINTDDVEPKYGWFAGYCFDFGLFTSDLDDARMDRQLAENGLSMAQDCLHGLLTFAKCWESVINSFLEDQGTIPVV